MIVKFPDKNNTWRQQNSGDLSGNIWASWNLDLQSNPGRVRVSPHTVLLLDETDGTWVVYPCSVSVGDFDGTSRYWVVGDDVMMKSTQSFPNNGTWVQDTLTGTPTDLNHLYSDSVEWDGSLFVSTGAGNIAKLSTTWDNDWWTATVGGAQINPVPATGIHLGKAFNNLLLIGNGNKIASAKLVGGVPTLDSNERLLFPDEFQTVWIRSAGSMVYFGCRNKNGGQASVFAWDGYSENFNFQYKINGSECFAGVIKDEICYTMNERGELLAFNGGGFSQIARLPVFNSDYNLDDSFTIPINVGRNSMAVQNNEIYILVAGSVSFITTPSNYAYLENQLSGVWGYNPETGLTHRYSINNNTGYGSPVITRSGFLFPTDKNSGNFLIGASMPIDAENYVDNQLRHGILDIDNYETDEDDKIGYFITPKIQAEGIEDMWQKTYLVIKKFLSSSSKVHVKYRTDYEDFGTMGVGISLTKGTWVTTSSFTVADASEVEAGDEIEIMSGYGSGLSANISSVNGTLIAIDESYTGATGTMLLRASNWKKVGTDIDTQGLSSFELPVGIPSSNIQFKVVMFFHGKEEIENFTVVSSPQIKPI